MNVWSIWIWYMHRWHRRVTLTEIPKCGAILFFQGYSKERWAKVSTRLWLSRLEYKAGIYRGTSATPCLPSARIYFSCDPFLCCLSSTYSVVICKCCPCVCYLDGSGKSYICTQFHNRHVTQSISRVCSDDLLSFCWRYQQHANKTFQRLIQETSSVGIA